MSYREPLSTDNYRYRLVQEHHKDIMRAVERERLAALCRSQESKDQTANYGLALLKHISAAAWVWIASILGFSSK